MQVTLAVIPGLLCRLPLHLGARYVPGDLGGRGLGPMHDDVDTSNVDNNNDNGNNTTKDKNNNKNDNYMFPSTRQRVKDKC